MLTLFAGACGADVGLSRAGFDHILGVEIDPDAAEAGRQAGFPVATGDVGDLSLYVKDCRPTVIWSSFPCQDHSTAGPRVGGGGDRNGWPATLEVIDHVNPVWVIAENVTGLVQHNSKAHRGEGPDGSVRDKPPSVDEHGLLVDQEWWRRCSACWLHRFLLPSLRERFAWVDHRVLDAADFGVPQRRRRVFIVAGPGPIAWPSPTHSGESLAKAKWVTEDYWQDAEGPVGEPSAQEARWLKQLEQLDLFRPQPPRFSLQPWSTVRHALGLAAWAPAVGWDAAFQGEARSPDQPSSQPVAGGNAMGGLYGWPERPSVALSSSQNTGPADNRREHVVSIDLPAPTVRAQDGTGHQLVSATSVGVRVLGGGANPRERGDLETRALRDLTDEPCTTIAAQVGGGAGNAGPFIETRAATEPGRLDRPSPTVTTTEEKGTRGDNMNRLLPSGAVSGGPDRAADAFWLATGRRRLTVQECAALQGFPAEHPFQGTLSAQYRQVGNAVPPVLAEVVSAAVKDANWRTRGEEG